MRHPDDFEQNIKIDLVRLYLESREWSHRRLQSEILGIDAPPRGGGYVAMEILRSFGLVDDSLKGLFLEVDGVGELNQVLSSSVLPESTRLLIRELYRNFQNLPDRSKRTFLLTWNPEKWVWDNVETDLKQFQDHGKFVMRWGCGNRTDIKNGDRLFFIKLGSEFPRGIIGSGHAVRQSYEAEHWDGDKERVGWNVDISFDVLLDFHKEPHSILSYETLISDEKLKNQTWSPRASGVIIESPVDNYLEELWRSKFISQITKCFNSSPLGRKEGKAIEVMSKRYERDKTAREECLKIHSHACLACGLDFGKRYGPIGEGFIHVHHIIPISQRNGEYVPDPSKDLIPLCPNCHAMIHKLDPPYELEKLKEVLLETSKLVN